MLKVIAGATIFVAMAFGGPVLAQDTASLSPVIPAASVVYDPCKTVSENPETADAENGICVGGARAFLASLAGLDPAAADQALADAVAAIAPLATEDPACNKFDDEIAAAIRLLSTRSTTPEQATQIEEIAATIEACVTSDTAEIPGPTPTLADDSSGSGSPS